MADTGERESGKGAYVKREQGARDGCRAAGAKQEQPAGSGAGAEAPLVSIVMPAYNAVRTLPTAVESVLAQTCGDFELLIVDDCSSDATAAAAEGYAARDGRVRFLKNPRNMGAAEARNAGVGAARGLWVAFLDSDDAWTADKLEKQLRRAAESGGSFIFTGSAFMDAEGNRKIGVLHVPTSVTYGKLLKQNVISCSSVLIKRELIKGYPMAGERLHEDFAVWLKILRDGETAWGVDEPLLIYRQSAGSKSGNKWEAAKMTYRVYRYVGIGRFPAVWFWLCYVRRSLKKYSRIH